MRHFKRYTFLLLAGAASISLVSLDPRFAFARDIQLDGTEHVVCVKPGEPTQITFPAKVEGGRRRHSSLAVERKDNFLVIFSQLELSDEGERLPVRLENGTVHSLLIVPIRTCDPRDEVIHANY